MTRLLTFLLIVIVATPIGGIANAQVSGGDEPANDDTQATTVTQTTEANTDKPGPLADPVALGAYLQSMINQNFQAIEAITNNLELKKAIAGKDQERLTAMALEFQQQLAGSLRVRLYPTGSAALDFNNSPACGYACMGMIQAVSKGPPPAEALLYKTPEANITMVRGIFDGDGPPIGTIVVHYPYTLLKDAVSRLQDIGLYMELRQSYSGKLNVLFSHGSNSIKQGPAQKFVRVSNTRLSVGIWTPGGVAVEQYEPPTLPWIHIIAAGIILFSGLVVLMILRAKRAKRPAQKKIPKTKLEDAPFLNPEADNNQADSTLVLGGGAAEVDVSAYLKKEDITDLKKKMQTEDITNIRKK